NLQLLRNIAASIKPQTPRIYDVILQTSETESEAKLTAYIFDDDIVEVTITIRETDGPEIPGTLEETLGYKYTKTFELTGGGFIDVIVTARDAEDNIRIFEKTILIRIDPADDVFITSVTLGLLAIVAVALVYVGLLRKGVFNRKSRERKPDFYVPPPSIE
ncbi:MAG: hypothetical protein ACFE7R_08565, partial [Candidatus Hodarchaeota archaeon]